MTPIEEIAWARTVLQVPPLVTFREVRSRYRSLAKRFHPDTGGESEEMDRLNTAYAILKRYAEEFRFTFSDDEVMRQFPGYSHMHQFKL